MLSIQYLKTLLQGFGINNLIVKFDTDKKQIQTQFFFRGSPVEKTIAFEEIETIFSDTLKTNEKPPHMADLVSRDR